MTIERFSDRLAVYLEGQSAVEFSVSQRLPLVRRLQPDAGVPGASIGGDSCVRWATGSSHLAGSARLVRRRAQRALHTSSALHVVRVPACDRALWSAAPQYGLDLVGGVHGDG